MVADKGYHEQDFVEELKQMGIAAHVPPYAQGRTKMLGRPGALPAARVCGQPEEAQMDRTLLQLAQDNAQMRKTRHRGHRKLDWNFTLAAAAYNLTRMAPCSPEPPQTPTPASKPAAQPITPTPENSTCALFSATS